MSEIWKDLQEYPGYAVSDCGGIMNTTTGLHKKPSVNQQGIAMINMSVNSKQNVRSVAVLVAREFLQDTNIPSHFDTPIHLDGDRMNCRADNLLWRPRWFAVRYHQQFNPWQRANRFGFRKPVLINETEETFPNSWAAAIHYGLLDQEIFLATMNRTYVFPYNFTFTVLEDA